MFGDDAHAAGAEGVQKAKRWLESTTRLDASWIYPEEASRNKLAYKSNSNPALDGLARTADTAIVEMTAIESDALAEFLALPDEIPTQELIDPAQMLQTIAFLNGLPVGTTIPPGVEW
jgi:hypothetical protein